MPDDRSNAERAGYIAGMLAAAEIPLRASGPTSAGEMYSNMIRAAAETATLEGYRLVPAEPPDRILWRIMIAGEMDTTAPKASGLARAKAAYCAMLAAQKGKK